MVDTSGHKADIEVQSDVITPEIEANMRRLSGLQRVRMATVTRNTPLLSEEGRHARLAILEERQKR
ncbi:MAG: hypothetical protein ABIH46_02400 [Chloroflexota bacterium]